MYLLTPRVFPLILILFSSQVYAWGWKDFKAELASPITTDAKYVGLAGTVTTVGVIVFEDQIVDPTQEEFVNDRPLGKWSKFGDLAGQMVPNGIYSIGQTIAGASGNTKGYSRALGMLKASAYAGSVTTVLKYSIREPRPDNKKDRNSFPSGHTTMAFAFGGYVFEEHGWKWGIPALAVSSFSAASRINDNRHYLHDVLAGATIGLVYGMGISKLEKKEGSISFRVVPLYDYQTKGLAFIKDY